tara:strand:- start:2210 stop:6199 length:3990 start_codon:yes stop_codon:yes gene_type:complete
MATSIIKCYDTEENAINGGAEGLIASSTNVDSYPFAFTVNSIGNGIYNRADHVPFFIFTRYFFRFESNDPVIAFHVDWDDGEDNSDNRNNFEIVEVDGAVGFYAVTGHIYSKIGTFWPMIRAESEEGFVSKWYTNDNNTGYKHRMYNKVATATDTVPHGRQDTFGVREEKTSDISSTTGFRIPHMRPANLPPIAVIKTDNKRVFAGIDNEQIDFRSGQKPLLYAWSDSTAITNAGDEGGTCNIRVTMEVEGDDDAQVREYTLPVQNDTRLLSSNWDENDIRDDCAPQGGLFGAGAIETQTIRFDAGDTAGVDINGTPTSSASFNEKFIKIAGGTAGITSTNFIVQFKHAAVAQSATLVCGDSTPGAMGNAGSGTAPYIDLRSALNGTHRFWLNCSGSNTAPSAPSSGFLEEIDISSDANANAIAATIDSAIENGITISDMSGGTTTSDQFSSSVVDNRVTITHAAGYVSHDTHPWTLNNLAGGSASSLTTDTVGEAAGGDSSLGGHTLLTVEFTSGDSANTLASLTATAINANANFTASADTNTVSYSPVVTGNMVDADNSTTNGSNNTQDVPSLTLATTAAGSSSTGSINPSRRLFKAKLNDIDTLADNDRVYIKVHNFDLDTDGTASPDSGLDNTVAILSNGNPIVELNDRLSKVLLDGGESHTRAGNTVIKNYYFDLDKNLITSGGAAISSTSVSNSVGELTGKFSDYFNNFNDYTKETTYTHHNLGFSTDSDGRFEGFSRLCRLQVEDDSARFLLDTAANEGCAITRSIIDLTESRHPEQIIRVRLNARKSYTKGAVLTQASTGATGTVYRSTFNQNYVDLHKQSKVSNFDASGTAITVSSNALVSNITGDDDDGYPLALSSGSLRLIDNFFENGTNQFLIQSTNQSGLSNNSANFPSSNTTTLDGAILAGANPTTSFDLTSASGIFIGDILKINNAELVKVTAISSNTITVKRGYHGTTIAAASDDDSVKRAAPNWGGVSGFNDDGTNPISGGSATAQQWNVSSWTASNSFQNDMPENFIRMSMQKKWNGVYLRMGHSFKPFIDAGSANGPAKVKLSMWYGQSVPPNKDSTTQIYDWKPLEFIDYTNELRTSGVLKFNPPEDWAYCTDNDLCENNGTYNTTENWKGPVLNDSAKTSYDPYYHILIGWSAKDDSNTDTHMAIQNAWPIGNQHSVLIDVIDPHHVNLNSIALAQSLAYKREGKFNIVTDKLGKSDIRRIGAAGGGIKFGGIDLGSDETGRNKIKTYQQNATPVFLDITHNDDSKTRFYGVITSMSEDMPTGKMTPKWAVQFQCSYCVEMSSTGAMTSDKIALGGVINDVSKYLLQS